MSTETNHTEPNRIRVWRRARGWTLQQLAEAVCTNKSQIDKLEKGDRRLTVDWMVRIAKPLGCDPRDLLADIPAFQAVRFGASSVGSTDMLPIKKLLQTGVSGDMLFANDPIDQIPRPYYLAHARDAYALYMPDNSMAPMYRSRQLLFVNPYKPPIPNGGVVVTLKNGTVFIREFVSETAKVIVTRSYSPTQSDLAIQRADIAALHVVAGTTEP